MSSKKLPVSINIFPALDYIELVQYDSKTGEIEKTTSLPCHFDAVTRQMSDREQTAQSIRDLFNTNRIPFNTPTALVLPSFFTREIELPTEFTREELRFALISEAERFYIFKKIEPQIDWINLDESRLLYSAFPKTEIEKYMQIFQDLRIPLVGIELSYFSILRGLVATGAVSAEIDAQDRWCFLAISDHSFFASLQQGIRILKTTDAPLSVTAEEELAAIHEIQQDFGNFTDGDAFSKLIVVNNSNSINSSVLLEKLAFHGNLYLIEQNALTLRSRGASDAQFPCSLEAIGGVFYNQLPELPKMNFILETGEDVLGILEYKKMAFHWLLIANAGVFFLCLMLWGAMTLMLWQKDQERDSLNNKISQLGAGTDARQLNEVNRKKFVKKVVDQNVKVNNLMVKLGSAVSSDVWIEKAEITSDKPDQPIAVNLEGKALSLDPVKAMNNALNTALGNGDLDVSNAAQATTQDGQGYFTWTIQNKPTAATTGQPAVAPPQRAPGG